MKKINEILVEGGPCFNKTEKELLIWLERYKDRNQTGDINVIKFLEYILDVTTKEC